MKTASIQALKILLLLNLFFFLSAKEKKKTEKKPFINAIVVSKKLESGLLNLEPIQNFNNLYKVKSIESNPSKVAPKKLLLSLDSKELETFIKKTKSLLEKTKASLQKEMISFQRAKKKGAYDLNIFRANLKKSEKKFAFFKKKKNNFAKRSLDEILKNSKNNLLYQEEELKQLLRVYKEDGLLEDTEEIIITRQKNSVQKAKFNYERAKANYEFNKDFVEAESIRKLEKDLFYTKNRLYKAKEEWDAWEKETLNGKIFQLKALIEKSEESLAKAKKNLKGLNFLCKIFRSIYLWRLQIWKNQKFKHFKIFKVRQIFSFSKRACFLNNIFKSKRFFFFIHCKC